MIGAGLFLALLLDRCLFMDFPFYNKHFAHELDFSWAAHRARLLDFGHDPNATQNRPERLPFGYETIGGEIPWDVGPCVFCVWLIISSACPV